MTDIYPGLILVWIIVYNIGLILLVLLLHVSWYAQRFVVPMVIDDLQTWWLKKYSKTSLWTNPGSLGYKQSGFVRLPDYKPSFS